MVSKIKQNDSAVESFPQISFFKKVYTLLTEDSQSDLNASVATIKDYFCW